MGPFKISMDLLPPWVMSTLEELVAHKSLLNSRIQLGFAFDGSWLLKEVIVNTFDKVKSLGIKVITTHYVRNASLSVSAPSSLILSTNPYRHKLGCRALPSIRHPKSPHPLLTQHGRHR
jgi:hypothetical protein